MARRSRSPVHKSGQRDASAIARRAAGRVYRPAAWVSPRPLPAKRLLGYGAQPHAKPSIKRPRFSQDARRFDPTRLLRSLWSGPVVSTPDLRRLRFKVPSRTLACVRRGIRREVIFALRKTSAGAGARHRRRTVNSSISCRSN
jgi:hypothetical protein